MSDFKMHKDNLRNKWAYLSDENSDLYDMFQTTDDWRDDIIKDLLEELARSSWAEHCNSRY